MPLPPPASFARFALPSSAAPPRPGKAKGSEASPLHPPPGRSRVAPSPSGSRKRSALRRPASAPSLPACRALSRGVSAPPAAAASLGPAPASQGGKGDSTLPPDDVAAGPSRTVRLSKSALFGRLGSGPAQLPALPAASALWRGELGSAGRRARAAAAPWNGPPRSPFPRPAALAADCLLAL